MQTFVKEMIINDLGYRLNSLSRALYIATTQDVEQSTMCFKCVFHDSFSRGVASIGQMP